MFLKFKVAEKYKKIIKFSKDEISQILNNKKYFNITKNILVLNSKMKKNFHYFKYFLKLF